MLIDNLKLNYSQNAKELIMAAQKENVSCFKLPFGNRTIISTDIASRLEGRAVYICSDSFSAKKAYEQFGALLGDKAILLPPNDDVLTYKDFIAVQNYMPRLVAINKIANAKDCIVITCIEAVCQLYPNKNDVLGHTLKLKQGGSYDLSILSKQLVKAGYQSVPLTVEEGQFSLRGDILDIYAIGQEKGFRLEFFGDELEKIKEYDIQNLGTKQDNKDIKSIVVSPATEVFYGTKNADTIIETLKKDAVKPTVSTDADSFFRRMNTLIKDLSTNSSDMRLRFLMPLLSNQTFSEFINPSIVFYDDAKSVADIFDSVYSEFANRYKDLLSHGAVIKSSLNQFMTKEKALNFSCPKTSFHSLDSQNRLHDITKVFNFKPTIFTQYGKNLDTLLDDVNIWLGNNYRVILFAGSNTAKENLHSLFFSHPDKTQSTGKLEVLSDYLPESAAFFDEKVIIVGTNSLTVSSKKMILKKKKRDSFTEPKVGSFVVHRYHGIGFCEEVKRLEIGTSARDYIVIKYAGGDTLFVPVENMDSLSHYENTAKEPKLNKLGGAEFGRIKEKAKEAASKMALDLTKIYADRASKQGHKYVNSGELLESFSASFIHNETECQLEAISECIDDLKKGKVMDRLLCGDVGYGKTEVAMRTAFKVIEEGKQVAFLAPTTILARQHYNTVQKRMSEFGIKVASLTRFDSTQNIASSIEKLKNGTVDIVCGTHRLLSKDVSFKDLGLLVLDEEQRFGVADKEKIKALKADINVLTLTATPIPRTLHLSLSGIRDISVLDTPPAARLPVKTFVTEFTESLVYDAVVKETGRGGQVFILYNKVEKMAAFASTVKSILPDNIRVAIAHAQMTADKLEDTIADFAAGKFDVLIASTIIENGIDMPNANTLIVVDSDRFGLAQLYQLRGRVGRSSRLAYAYFTFDAKRILTENAQKRLEAIMQFTEFGSGFKIAMRDLEIRGAGNILGREQHGHVDKVGYDMYCKILEECIEEAKTGKVATIKDDVKIITDFNAFLPNEFVEDGEGRQRVYSRVSQVTSLSELKALKKELAEIYGTIPPVLDNLLLVALIKNLAAKINAKSVMLKKQDCSIIFNKTIDIPPNSFNIGHIKVDTLKSKLNFGTNREALVRYLLQTA